MKKTSPSDLDMLPGYDFTRAVRGHYAGCFAQGYTVRVEKTDGSTEETRFIRLVPDLAAAFPTDEAVSAALREWLRANQPLGIFDDTPTVTRPQTGKTIGMKT